MVVLAHFLSIQSYSRIAASAFSVTILLSTARCRHATQRSSGGLFPIHQGTKIYLARVSHHTKFVVLSVSKPERYRSKYIARGCPRFSQDWQGRYCALQEEALQVSNGRVNTTCMAVSVLCIKLIISIMNNGYSSTVSSTE